MSGILGLLNLSDTDRVFTSTQGQQAVYEAITQVVTRYNADLQAQLAVFVERTTSNYKLRYKLPGGGRLERLGRQAPGGAVKAYGQWDVAFPLEGFGRQIAGARVDMAYMTAGDLDRHLKTVMIQDVNTVRFEVLKALLNNTQRTFSDPLWGDLSIEPLANGDTVVYPPVIGSEDEATEDHYLESGYAAGAISDTNNPYKTIADDLDHHFGTSTGGDNIVVFINNAQTAKTKDLTDFDEVPDRFIRTGANTDVPIGLPNVPGKILGRVSGCWAVEWRWIPANYMLGSYMDAPKPLIERIDPADTGLGQGLLLVAEDERHPLKSSYWEHRTGFGAGNRLNGVVMELGTGGTYDIPSGYS